jgi:hypothetical protein
MKHLFIPITAGSVVNGKWFQSMKQVTTTGKRSQCI